MTIYNESNLIQLEQEEHEITQETHTRSKPSSMNVLRRRLNHGEQTRYRQGYMRDA